MTATTTTIGKTFQSAIRGAIFGRGDAGSRRHRRGISVDAVHALSLQFVSAAPMGGGAMLAIQALNGRAVAGRGLCD